MLASGAVSLFSHSRERRNSQWLFHQTQSLLLQGRWTGDSRIWCFLGSDSDIIPFHQLCYLGPNKENRGPWFLIPFLLWIHHVLNKFCLPGLAFFSNPGDNDTVFQPLILVMMPGLMRVFGRRECLWERIKVWGEYILLEAIIMGPALLMPGKQSTTLLACINSWTQGC